MVRHTSESQPKRAARQGEATCHTALTDARALGQITVIQPLDPTLSALRPAAKSDLHALVENHLPLVGVLVAERLRGVPAHVRRDELMSAGMIALVLSAGAYNPELGVPFRIFAAFRIRGALIDELRSLDWVTRSVRSRGRQIETVRERLTAALNRPPGNGDIAVALGISAGELSSVYADLARGTVVSLQSMAPEMYPGAASDHTDDPESLILHREQLGYLRDAVAALPERLRFVVVSYFFQLRQMSDIAIDMAVSQSRVSQMCTEATALIRDGMNSQLDPDTLPASNQTGRVAAARHAYYLGLAERSTVAGRLDMSTLQGEMRSGLYPEQVRESHRSRIA